MKHLSLIALIIIAGLFAASFFVVQEGTEGVLYQSAASKENPTLLKPGLHFKVPGFQKKEVIDLRKQLFSADGTTDRPYLSVQTFDKQNLEVGYDILWQVTDTKEFYQAERKGSVINGIRQGLDKQLSSAIAKLTLVQWLNNDQRAQVINQIQTNLQKNVKGAGAQIISIAVNDMNVPAAERDTWLDRMKSQQQGQLAQLQLQTSTLAQTLKSNIDTKIATILTQGQQQANEIRAQANAKATEIYNRAYQKDPGFYKFYHDLEAYEETIGSKDVLIFSTNNPFFKSLAPTNSDKN